MGHPRRNVLELIVENGKYSSVPIRRSRSKPALIAESIYGADKTLTHIQDCFGAMESAESEQVTLWRGNGVPSLRGPIQKLEED